jgi:hypothetical protein
MAETVQSSATEAAEAAAQAQMMSVAFRNPMVPKLYGNLVVIAQTASDVSLIVTTNGNPVGIVNLSYVTAKSLIEDLSNAVATLEKATDGPVATIREISVKMQTIMDTTKNVKL